jgi:hypothetical protein
MKCSRFLRNVGPVKLQGVTYLKLVSIDLILISIALLLTYTLGGQCLIVYEVLVLKCEYCIRMFLQLSVLYFIP